MAGAKIFQEKARKAFRFFDLDKDGIVTKDEMIASADRISALSSATDFERNCTRLQFVKWVDALFPDGSIDETTFSQRAYKLWTEDKESVNFECSESIRHCFKLMDSNKDGHLSEDELADYYRAFGYDSHSFVKKVFIALDKNKDGLISEEEMVEAFTKYWSSEPVFEFLYDPSH